ncbi:Hypothetical predicted protein [Scomber scombrus]|uniref:Uncharacterized protein n=1 Tax=Scomber scombrus TaxID=13677 RepID=A0AAV1QBH9_SCOSC
MLFMSLYPPDVVYVSVCPPDVFFVSQHVLPVVLAANGSAVSEVGDIIRGHQSVFSPESEQITVSGSSRMTQCLNAALFHRLQADRQAGSRCSDRRLPPLSSRCRYGGPPCVRVRWVQRMFGRIRFYSRCFQTLRRLELRLRFRLNAHAQGDGRRGERVMRSYSGS